jgi:hypothetical protein
VLLTFPQRWGIFILFFDFYLFHHLFSEETGGWIHHRIYYDVRSDDAEDNQGVDYMKKKYAELSDVELCEEYNGIMDSGEDNFHTYDSVFDEMECLLGYPTTVEIIRGMMNQCIRESLSSIDDDGKHDTNEEHYLYHITYNGIEAVNKDDARMSMISALKHSK